MREQDKAIFNRLNPVEAIALTMYGEARGESTEGILAVGYVICNRSRLWHQSIKEVCYAKNQFSCYLSSDWNYEILLNVAMNFPANLQNNGHLSKCLQCAVEVYQDPASSNVGDATFYRVKGNKNKWFNEQIEKGKFMEVCQIGAHIFYEEVK